MTESNTGHFGQYGKNFQEKIFQCLLIDNDWSTQMSEVMTHEYFDIRYLSYLTEKFFSYFRKYKSFPSLHILITIVRDDLREGKDILLRDQVVEFLHRIKASSDMSDLQFVKEKTLDFCRKKAMRDALEESVSLISADKYDSVIDVMKQALSVGTPSTVGHDFFQDIEARFTKINRVTCPQGS